MATNLVTNMCKSAKRMWRKRTVSHKMTITPVSLSEVVMWPTDPWHHIRFGRLPHDTTDTYEVCRHLCLNHWILMVLPSYHRFPMYNFNSWIEMSNFNICCDNYLCWLHKSATVTWKICENLATSKEYKQMLFFVF